MILLLDIGNTHTHLGLANSRRVVKQANIPTVEWADGRAKRPVIEFAGSESIAGACLCSVVPRVTPVALKAVWCLWSLPCLELSPKTLRGVGIDYPQPS